MSRSENFSAVLRDPVQLSDFLREAQEIAELTKPAQQAAITMLLQGINIPGWILRRKENRYVLPSALLPLAQESIETVLEMVGTISEQRYRRLCALCGVRPDPSAIIKAGPSCYLTRSSAKVFVK